MDTPLSEKTHVEFSPADLAKATTQSKVYEDGESHSPLSSSAETVAVVEHEEAYPDGGYGWVVVLGCVLFSSTTVGWSLAWGVVQTYYQKHLFPNASGTVLSTLGSASGMIMTLASMVTGKLGDRFGYKPFLAAGGVFWFTGMLASAFCTKLWQFFITQGLLEGIAAALIFPLVMALPAQWFLKYRAFATGIVIAGASLGGAISSLVMYRMLSSLGLKKTFAIYSAMDAVCFIVGLLIIKERRPTSKRPRIIWFDRTFLRDPVFWSLGSCFLFTVFGYLTPIFFLPTFANDKIPNMTDFLSTLPVTVLNLAAATGRVSTGFVADRIGPVNSMFIAILMSGLAQILVWNFVTNYAGTIAFAVLYGFFCGCFISLSPAVAARLYGSGRLAGLSGLLLFFNLPGNSAGAPIGGAILNATGGNWQAVASYSGSMQLAGAGLLLYARFKKQPKVIANF
ncbi:hypothetical protein AcW1_002325 [Taiwanofungus camphoratus]|nr:hypothetical protein AcV5_010325 [Antrodia cinnamomea]KAI0944665.1 hypothetical protein AcW1_002325 [Antrodia cinnamomea]